jgi:hypothetical protein
VTRPAPVVALLVAVTAWVGACATGTGDDGDGGVGAAGPSSSSSAGNGGGPASSSSSGGPSCQPDEHLCGGLCTGNTVESGCSQSTDCAPCPTDPNGTTSCTTEGLCQLDCAMPYLRIGDTCDCATECCANSDCDVDEICEMGACKVDCSMGTQTYTYCLALCGVQNMSCDPITCTCV